MDGDQNNQPQVLQKAVFVKKYLAPVGIAFVAIIFIAILASVMSSDFGGMQDLSVSTLKPTTGQLSRDAAEESYAPSYVPGIPMPPTTGGGVTELEAYETTRYDAQARTRALDEACTSIESLKVRSDIYFRSLNKNEDRCSASFFSVPDAESEVVNTLRNIPHMKVQKTVSSATAIKQRITTELEIQQDRLQTIENTISSAEAQYEALANQAQNLGTAAELSQAITEKLRIINQLQSERISIAARIQNILRQQADLDERIDHVEFNVTITRAFAFDDDAVSRKWEAAWENLKVTFTEVLIGFTALLGIIVLRTLQIVLYLLILIIVARYVWKFARLIWKKL